MRDSEEIFLIVKQNYTDSGVRICFSRWINTVLLMSAFIFSFRRTYSRAVFATYPQLRARAQCVRKCNGMLVQDIAGDAFEVYTNLYV